MAKDIGEAREEADQLEQIEKRGIQEFNQAG